MLAGLWEPEAGAVRALFSRWASSFRVTVTLLGRGSHDARPRAPRLDLPPSAPTAFLGIFSKKRPFAVPPGRVFFLRRVILAAIYIKFENGGGDVFSYDFLPSFWRRGSATAR